MVYPSRCIMSLRVDAYQAVQAVSIRPATEEERQAHTGSVLTRLVQGVWARVVGVKNFVQMVKSRDMSAVLANARGSDPFFSETAIYTLKKCKVLGAEIPLPHLMQFYITDHPAVLKATLQPPRQSEGADDPYFLHDDGHSFGTFVKELFYKDGGKDENFILTCSAERSKELRAFMHAYLKEGVLKKRENEIKQIAVETVAEWRAHSGRLNARALSKIYINKVLTTLFFGGCQDLDKLGWAIDIFSKYLMGKIIGQTPPESEVESAIAIFSQAVEDAYKRGGEHNVAYDMKMKGTFSDEDIKLMVWTFYFGAVDNSSESLTWALLMLAQNQEMQDLLRHNFSAYIGAFLAENLRTFPPVHGVGRMINATRGAVVEIELQDGQKIERYLDGGKMIAMRIQDAARRSDLFGEDVDSFNIHRRSFGEGFKGHLTTPFLPFGGGSHVCPGWKLALDEMACLVDALLQTSKITTTQMELPETKGTALNKIVGEVFIELESL